MISEALVVDAPNSIRFTQVEVPEPTANQVLVEAAYSCVSPGTEIRYLKDQNSFASGFPYVPGYAMAGTVIKAGAESGYQPGARVFCGGTDACSVSTQWGAHIRFAVRDAAKLVPVPDHVSLLDAAVAKLGAIAHRGTVVAGACQGKRVGVVGLGPIGQLSARIFHAKGADVCCGDIQEGRIALLKELGIKTVNTRQGVLAAFAQAGHDQCDIVVDATGVPALIPQNIELARDKPWDESLCDGAIYLVQGSYPTSFAIPYHEAFVKELSFRLPRDSQLHDLRAVIQLVAEGRMTVRDLMGRVAKPSEVVDVFNELMQPNCPYLTAAFDWSQV